MLCVLTAGAGLGWLIRRRVTGARLCLCLVHLLDMARPAVSLSNKDQVVLREVQRAFLTPLTLLQADMVDL